ncbi:MAG: radical SAM protein [Planctomycetota bacterium]
MNWSQTLSHLRAAVGILHGSRAFGGPIQAGLALTWRCNLRCLHCYYFSPHAENRNTFELRRMRREGRELPEGGGPPKPDRVDADTARTNSLIDELVAMGTRRFQFSGAGEAFLHPDILEFMARAKRLGCYCLSNTNGTLLVQDTADALARMGFDELRVTTMAGDREMYLATHPGSPPALFDRLTDNLRYIAERKRAKRMRKPKVTLVCVVVRANASGLADFARFACSVDADGVLFKPFDDVADPGLVPLAPSPEDGARIEQDLSRAKDLLEARGLKHNIPHFLHAYRQRLDTRALYRVIPCYYGWLMMRIEVGGAVYPCCRCYNPLGDIYERGAASIWNGSTYRKFRREALDLNTRLTPVTGCDCARCVHHVANLRVYRALHPVAGRSKRIERLRPVADGED